MSEDLERFVNLSDFEVAARAAMEPGPFDYYAGGSGDMVTLAESVTAFRRFRLRPRVLVDISKIDTRTTLLGTEVSMPVGLAPTAMHYLADPEGEVATARAAGAEDVLYCMSTLASRTIEDVAAPSGPKWFQLYVHKERNLSADLIRRAEGSGYRAIVLTVDLPVAGYREGEIRNRFGVDASRFANFEATDDQLIDVIASVHDQTLSWRDIEWLRSTTSLPLVIKGVLTAEDTALAVEHGADAIWVSTHGGRQLDGGVDVVTALALGARAVFVGRPYLFALAVAGEAGVRRCIEIMRAELLNAMGLLGAARPDQVVRGHLR